MAAPTDANPSAQTACLGVGWDAGDTKLSFMANDASGTCVKTDLGTDFPRPSADRTDAHRIEIWCAAGASSFSWRVTNLTSSAVATGTASSDIPGTGTYLASNGWMSVGGTSSVIGLAFMGQYAELGH